MLKLFPPLSGLSLLSLSVTNIVIYFFMFKSLLYENL